MLSLRSFAVAAAILLTAGLAQAQEPREGHLMRMADVSDRQIVFTYEDDLWIVPIEGGVARRLTNDPGVEGWAKFSPDGRQIAFTAQYDGGIDVYVMPAEGGVPRRLTYHPASDRVLDWWPDGKSIYFRSTREYPFRGEMVYRVPVEGGPTEKLPIDRAGLASVSPDGKMIAYNRITREAATWKRHRGGDAQDIWLGSLDKHDYRIISDTDWTSNFPMWHGDAVYFNSDREDGTLNLYRYDVPTGKTTRLTQYKDYDVKYPSMGPRDIVYQYGESLYLYDLASGKIVHVPISIPSDLVRMRPELATVSPSTGTFGLSPTGVRMFLEARGEVLSYPVKDGEPYNLTRAPGSREKNPAWSPDGRWVAFLSDKTGEEELYLVDQRGEKEWKQLTKGGLGYRLHLAWSPNSKHLLFSDKFMRLNLCDAQTGALSVVDRSDYDDGWERWGIQDYVWSPDSRWIAYTREEQSLNNSIYLYGLETRKSYRLTSDRYQDSSPSFDPEGKYLYFLSDRTFNPVMCRVDQNHAFLSMTRPYLVLLQADAVSPFAPKDAEEGSKEEAGKPGAKPEKEGDQGAEGKAKKAETAKPVKIDLEGIERRVVAVEGVSAGNIFRLEAIKGGFLYLDEPKPEFSKYSVVTDETEGELDLYKYDLEKKEATKVLPGIANYHLSADGKKLVYRAGSKYGVVDAGSVAKVGDGEVKLGDLKIEVDRSAEFMQIFNEAWRIERDWFYDPGMHGLDWKAVGEQYRKFVPFCGNRGDLTYLIGEMISELNIGHTYVYGGDLEEGARRVSTGMLGADFAVEPGGKYYRIARIIPGTPGNPDERSPLDEPGCPVRSGHYLIAIDGQEVTSSHEVYEYLQNKADKVVRLTYNDKPSSAGAKTCRVKTIGAEYAIRYREWVEKNRAYVNKASHGQIGYVHLPDMEEAGLTEFAQAWYAQYYKKGMIVDERYNTGGFVGDMIIDRLERQVWAVTQPREGKPQQNPERCFMGHWCVLINEDTGSNGEFFAETIKIKKLAPVIGKRTWGGSTGIEAHQSLVDGGTVTPPQFGLYGLDRSWPIEGHGVDPDVDVQNMPADVLQGKDAQLDTGIQNVLDRIKQAPVELPQPPAYPRKAKPLGS